MKTFCKTIIVVIIIFIFSCTTLFSQHWQALKKGLDYAVECFYTDTSDNLLYIGGWFRIADDSTITTGIATWNGVDFSPVGCGFDWDCVSPISPGFYPGHPKSIIKYNGDIYAGGGFLKADNKPIKGLAKWNGITWDSVRTGVNVVYSFLVNNNELYISGAFDNESVYITKWDGITWSNLPLFPTYGEPIINTMAYYKNELYVGGNFYSSAYPNDTIQDIIRYDGSNWKSVGGGFHGGWSNINCFATYKNELYVGGYFKIADGNPGNHIAKWDGNNWSDIGGGMMGIGSGDSQIHDLIVYNDELYAGGVFSYAGGVPAKYIAKWDGTNWCGLGSYFDNRILGLGVYQDMLYVGGGFWTIDGDSINSVAKWTGGSYIDTCGNMTGVYEIVNGENDINVYPNPSDGAFTISYGTLQPSIYIYNSLGKLIYKKEKAAQACLPARQGSEQIDLSAYSKGIYFIKVQRAEKVWNKKIIIE